MEKRYIPIEEIKARTELNFQRMSDDYYDIDHVFAGDDAEWPGDKEGRALLAFVSLYKSTGRKIPCMDLMMDKIPEKTSNRMFFGNKTEKILFEQQLSGTSWYLR